MYRWIGSLSTFFVISGGLVAGRLFDRGYFYHLMIGGSLLLSFSLFMLSLCKPEKFYQVFLAHGVGVGLGAGTTYVPSIAVVSHYFQRRRAIAMAIVSTGSSLGAVVHPIMLNNTLRTHLGFGNSVRASAGLVSGLLLTACFLMRPRLPPPATNPPLWKSLKRFARDRVYLTAIGGMVTYTGGFYFPIFYLQLDAISHGVNQTLGFYSLVILNGAGCVGRFWPGFFAHRLGVINMVMAATGCGAVLILSMIALKSVASVVAIGVLYGFWAGVFVTLMAPLVAVLTENVEELGLRMGIAFGIVGISALVCPPIDGILLTEHFMWWRPALFSGVLASTGFCFFVLTAIGARRRAAAKIKRAETPVIHLETMGVDVFEPPPAIGNFINDSQASIPPEADRTWKPIAIEAV
ncbi:major facilitator superfamily domain-containing protein [Mycena pura]|uniref:Major facilitator superfamily domain-containing protein n=1 Tax=Mycena pura TaxID=153505 RepID=A0AAD6YVC5_9AGAR|nr:major facilitator superfamily domain-containing protein [Mycena pura]